MAAPSAKSFPRSREEKTALAGGCSATNTVVDQICQYMLLFLNVGQFFLNTVYHILVYLLRLKKEAN